LPRQITHYGGYYTMTKEKLAADWADEDQGSFHRRRAFRVRNDGGLRHGARFAPVGFETQSAPNLPSISACHATTTRALCGSCGMAPETGVL